MIVDIHIAGFSLGSLTVVVCVLISAFYYLIVNPAFVSPLAHVPNAQWSSPFSRLWILAIRWGRRENKTLHDLHRRLGHVIRLGPNELSIDDLASVRTVYQGGANKPAWYSVFDNYGSVHVLDPWLGGALGPQAPRVAHYSKSYIHSSPDASAQAHTIIYKRLLPILKESVSETQKPHGVDMYSVYMGATMDFVAGYVFGLAGGTNFLQHKPLRDHIFELYKSRNEPGLYDQELPRFTRFCRMLGIPFCPKWVDAANQELGEWCRRLCDNIALKASDLSAAQLEPSDEPVVWKAVVAGLKKEQAVSGKSSVLYDTALSNTRLSIASELFDHVLAGQETAAIVLSYLSWRLSQLLPLQHQLRAEILSLTTPNMRRLDDSSTHPIRDPKEVDTLPLLHAIIMETLRRHSPIPGYQPRQTPDSGCQIGGYKVPAGVRIAASAYSLHRDEVIFPDPEKWDHMRWVPPTGGGEERLRRQRQFWAFSSGGRMCVGSNFAMYEMKLVICAIYSNYTSHIVDDAGMVQQADGYAGRPAQERLILRFEKVV